MLRHRFKEVTYGSVNSDLADYVKFTSTKNADSRRLVLSVTVNNYKYALLYEAVRYRICSVAQMMVEEFDINIAEGNLVR